MPNHNKKYKQKEEKKKDNTTIFDSHRFQWIYIYIDGQKRVNMENLGKRAPVLQSKIYIYTVQLLNGKDTEDKYDVNAPV